jgi:hypothetical protein
MIRSLLLMALARPFAFAQLPIARLIREASRTSAGARTSIETLGAGRKYETAIWRDEDSSRFLDMMWERSSCPAGTLAAAYQSAAFFDYLREAEKDSRFEILTVIDARKAIVGVVPIKLSILHLPFSIGARKVAGSRLKSASIVGSEPMIAGDAAQLDSFFLALPEHHPEIDVIYMSEVPLGGDLWRYLSASATIRERYHLHVMDGFRECHSVPLPASLDEYYSRLHKKKRYNLARQERLLRNLLGPLDLVSVDEPATLPELFQAIDVLTASNPKASASTEQYICAAKRGFLKCFVLKAGDRPIAVALGTRIGKTYRIDRFVHDESLERYSPGTTLWQMVLKELIAGGQFTSIYMGYGNPAYRYRATNIIEYKGRVLLYRRSLRNRFRILIHLTYSAVCGFIKSRIARDARSDRPCL